MENRAQKFLDYHRLKNKQILLIDCVLHRVLSNHPRYPLPGSGLFALFFGNVHRLTC